jgi:zeaxanthin glucosyltransferase
MKIGFICPNLPGHINPMSALARHLQARGHDVVFLYLSSANGLPCIPGDKRDDINANRPEMSKLEGNEALAFYCGVAAKETEAIFRSLPRIVEKTGVEALVLDPIQFFVELAAMKLRIPYVTVANALYIDFSGYTPAGIFGWPHETTPDALARNLQAVTEAVRFCYNEGTKSYAKELGFKTDLDHPSWIFSELAYITQLPKKFDFEHPLLPPQFHYTGPFHDGKGRHPLDFPWDRLTGEPLIYASMGTIMNGRADVFRTIAAGVANHSLHFFSSLSRFSKNRRSGFCRVRASAYHRKSGPRPSFLGAGIGRPGRRVPGGNRPTLHARAEHLSALA